VTGKMRVSVVGVGHFGRNHARIYAGMPSLGELYKKPKAGIKKQHVFKFTRREAGVMYAQEVDGEPWSTDQLLRGNVGDLSAVLSVLPVAIQILLVMHLSPAQLLAVESLV